MSSFLTSMKNQKDLVRFLTLHAEFLKCLPMATEAADCARKLAMRIGAVFVSSQKLLKELGQLSREQRDLLNLQARHSRCDCAIHICGDEFCLWI